MATDSCDILAGKKCIPCQGGVPALKGEELHELHSQLQHGWQLISDHHIEKVYEFEDFKSALAFTNKVGEIAEEEQHHPDILTAWGKVKISLWTHKVDGLTEADFVLAAKIEKSAAA